MLSSLGTCQSLFKYQNSIPSASVSISSISGSNVSSNANPSSYAISGHNVYQIINTNAMSTSGGTAVTNVSGTFNLSVSVAPATLHYIVIGGGGGGGSGSQGGGGGSSGQIQYGSLTIPIGSYSCSFQIGGGGPGSGYTGSSPTFSNGTNGYGVVGGNSTLTINGTTITSVGGSAGGTSYYSNGCTTGAYGGGAGCCIGNGNLTGSNGTVSNHGGNASNSSCTSGGGGGSPSGNGANGSFGSSSGSQSVSGVGGLGAAPISSTTIGWNFSSVQYFCEGGHGSASYANNPPIATVNGQISNYALAGYSSGIGYSTYTTGQKATQSVNHTGSGGSGCFAQNGLGTSNAYAPSGANGVILLYY